MKKINILILVAFLMLLVFVPLMAQVVEPGGEQPEWVVKTLEALMPLILLAVVSVSKLKDKIPGIWMLVVMGGLSAVATFFMNQATDPTVPWYFYIVYNLSGTFFHQLRNQWKSGN